MKLLVYLIIFYINNNKEFEDKIIYKIKLIENYGSFNFVKENKLCGYVKTNNIIYTLNVSIKDNLIKYTFENNDETKMDNGAYLIISNEEYETKYENEKKIIYYPYNQKNVDVDNKKEYHYFKNNTEYQYDIQEIKENYYVINNQKFLKSASPFENYKEERKYQRVNKKTLLSNKKKEYFVTDNSVFTRNEDSIYLKTNYIFETGNLEIDGNHIWLDKNLYNGFLTGKYTLDDLYKYSGDKYNKNIKQLKLINK